MLQILRDILQIPRMQFDLLHSNAFDGIRLEHSINKILNVRRYVVRHVKLSFFDLVKQLRHRVIIKGQLAAYHSK